METVATILWKRLDADGHDACRLMRHADGWSIDGAAVFSDEGVPCVLRYSVSCDAEWRSRSAFVAGWRGDADIRLDIERANATWLLNGEDQPLAAGCVDLDLGFTPATNLLALRRLNLSDGQESAAPAAYLESPTHSLARLEQTYRRIDRTRYAYESPAFGYAELLTVSDEGFVTDYPGLWRQVLLAAPPH